MKLSNLEKGNIIRDKQRNVLAKKIEASSIKVASNNNSYLARSFDSGSRSLSVTGHQVQATINGAVSEASRALKEANLGGLHFVSASHKIESEVRSARMHLIREAFFNLSYEFPTTDGERTASSKVDIGVVLENGRFSVLGLNSASGYLPLTKNNLKAAAASYTSDDFQDEDNVEELEEKFDKKDKPKSNKYMLDKKHKRESEAIEQEYNGYTILLEKDHDGSWYASVLGEPDFGRVTGVTGDQEEAIQEIQDAIDAQAETKEYDKSVSDFWPEDELVEASKKSLKKKVVSQTGILSNPEDNSVNQADPDTEMLRQEVLSMESKVSALRSQIQSYQDALASKTAQELGIDANSYAGLEAFLAQTKTTLDTKIKNLEGNFIRFADNVIYAKVQGARLNDASWKDMIDSARTNGRGVMKRVTSILDKISILFKKMTANVSLKEYAPGTLTPKEQDKLTKKNVENVGKINKYQEDVKKEAPGVSKYFLDNAEGMIQTPGFKGGQKEESNLVKRMRNNPASWVIINKETNEVIMETFDKKKVDHLNTEKYEAVPIYDYLVSLNKKKAQSEQLEFGFLQELDDQLDEQNAEIEKANAQIEALVKQLDQQAKLDEAYPFPREGSKLKFTSANSSLNTIGVRRTIASLKQKGFSKREINEYLKSK